MTGSNMYSFPLSPRPGKRGLTDFWCLWLLWRLFLGWTGWSSHSNLCKDKKVEITHWHTKKTQLFFFIISYGKFLSLCFKLAFQLVEFTLHLVSLPLLPQSPAQNRKQKANVFLPPTSICQNPEVCNCTGDIYPQLSGYLIVDAFSLVL